MVLKPVKVLGGPGIDNGNPQVFRVEFLLRLRPGGFGNVVGSSAYLSIYGTWSGFCCFGCSGGGTPDLPTKRVPEILGDPEYNIGYLQCGNLTGRSIVDRGSPSGPIRGLDR